MCRHKPLEARAHHHTIVDNAFSNPTKHETSIHITLNQPSSAYNHNSLTNVEAEKKNLGWANCKKKKKIIDWANYLFKVNFFF